MDGMAKRWACMDRNSQTMGMPKLLQTDKLAIYSEDKIWPSFLCTKLSLYTPVNRVSYEITFVLLSLIPSFDQFNSFLRGSWSAFSDFFMKLHYCLFENWQSLILYKIHFCSYLDKKSPKMAHFVFLYNFNIWFPWKLSGRSIIVILDYPFQIIRLGKFWFLNYRPRYSRLIRLHDSWKSNISQISYKSSKLVGLDRTWLKMTKVIQNDQQYIKEIRNSQAFFVYWFSP